MKKVFFTLALVSGSLVSDILAAQQVPSLDELAHINNLTPMETFKKERAGLKPFVVKFSKKGCPPCKATEPAFAKMAANFENQATFVVVDAQKYSSIIDTYKLNIRSVPTFIIFGKGKELGRIKGSGKINELPALIKNFITKL